MRVDRLPCGSVETWALLGFGSIDRQMIAGRAAWVGVIKCLAWFRRLGRDMTSGVRG